MKKTILHITAGADNWTPTQRELTALTNKFKRALKNATPNNTPVVVTRAGVQAQIIEYDPVVYATSGYVAPFVANHATPGVAQPFQPYTITNAVAHQQVPPGTPSGFQ